MFFRSNQPGFLAAVKGTFPSIPACLSVCLFVYLPPIHLAMRQSLYVCNHAG
jgi:hypothetical protein